MLELLYNAFNRLLLDDRQWNYTASDRNEAAVGDGWNQEDLSIFSRDQQDEPGTPDSGGRAVRGFCRPRAHLAAAICLIALPPTVGADEDSRRPEMVRVPGGTVTLGSERGMPDEWPKAERELAPFLLDRTPVTVGAFADFVEETGYETTAEKFGDSAVFDAETGRWTLVPGASWRVPRGPEHGEAADDHPVTQVSWHDARAYCAHRGKRLPAEAEWEHAAKNGRNAEVRYAFGDRIVEDGTFLANVWTGRFPYRNTLEDGFLYTSPVGEFGRTELGLTDMAGNVWEWTADWYLPYDADPAAHVATASSEKVQRGGSFLCDPKVCHGYRTSARGHSAPESSHMHVGFRCAADVRQR